MPNPAVHTDYGRIIHSRGEVFDRILKMLDHCAPDSYLNQAQFSAKPKRLFIINTANLTGGENVGGKASAAPAAPEASGDDDDGGGDGDSDPDHRRPPKVKRVNKKAPLPPSLIARPRQACSLLGIGRTKLYQLSEQDPRFPRKIVLGARCVGWRLDALEAYVRAVESGV